MKYVKQEMPKLKFFEIILEIFKVIGLCLVHILGTLIYLIIFLCPTYIHSNIPFNEISAWWLILFIVSFISFISHIHYMYSGKITSKSLFMFLIFLQMFLIPIAVAIVM